MIGFAKIAGGAPSSVRSLTDHLQAMTRPEEQERIAAYYTRGLEHRADRVIDVLAELVAEGTLTFSEAADSMVSDYIRKGGDLGRLDDEQERIHTVLAEATQRVQDGVQDAPSAVLRRDMHPIVAHGLGIYPELSLTSDQINGLLAGRKADGEKIGGKVYAKVRSLPVDPKTGEEKLSTPIGSYDFCPAPDKSVSVALAFAAPAESAMILNAHLSAARDAVAYIASEIGVGRKGAAGELEVPGHVTWLEFTHFTARRPMMVVEDGVAKETNGTVPGDPDVHTHFLIPNAVFGEDGSVGSLHTAKVAGFIFEADAFYQAKLAQNLRDAGFGAELDQRTGAAVMPAIPENVCRLFSKRTVVGEFLAEKYTAERGETWADLSEAQKDARIKAAAQSQEQKTKGEKDDMSDVADWRRQAKAAGWEAAASLLAYGPPAPELAQDVRLSMAYETALPFLAEKFEHRSVVKHWDVRVAALRGLVHAGIKGLSDINAVTQIMREKGVEQYGELTALLWGKEQGRQYVSVSTALHEGQEREFCALASKAAHDRSAALPRALIDSKVRESGLDFTGEHGKAQLAMIQRLGTGGRFSVAIAAAGAGKTTALRPLVTAWKEHGRQVIGASLAWVQADAMVDAGIAQRDVKAFSVLLDAAKAGEMKLDSGTVVAVDELGMLGTRQALELLRLQEKHQFTVVALGDDRQCGSVQAGATIDLCRRALGPEQVPEILTTVRQKTEREREIVGLLREGRAKEAIDMKRSDGTAEMVQGGYNDVIARTSKLYAGRLQATGQAPTISVPTNADAHQVSLAVRAERRVLGQLGPDQKRIHAVDQDGRQYDMALAVGDRVRLFKSTGARFSNGAGGNIGRNASVLEVRAIGNDGITLRAKNGREGRVSWESLTAKSGRVLLAYGDALTIHSAQGSTASEHIYAFPSGSQAVNGLQAYTAGTRHRTAAYLLTSDASEGREVRNARPLNDARTVSLDDKWANVAKNFANQPVKDTVMALFDRVERIRRGAVAQFPRRLQTAEQKMGRGEPPSHIQDRAGRRRVDVALSPVIRHLADYVQEMQERIRPVLRRVVMRQNPERPAPERQRAPRMTL